MTPTEGADAMMIQSTTSGSVIGGTTSGNPSGGAAAAAGSRFHGGGGGDVGDSLDPGIAMAGFPVPQQMFFPEQQQQQIGPYGITGGAGAGAGAGGGGVGVGVGVGALGGVGGGVGGIGSVGGVGGGVGILGGAGGGVGILDGDGTVRGAGGAGAVGSGGGGRLESTADYVTMPWARGAEGGGAAGGGGGLHQQQQQQHMQQQLLLLHQLHGQPVKKQQGQGLPMNSSQPQQQVRFGARARACMRVWLWSLICTVSLHEIVDARCEYRCDRPYFFTHKRTSTPMHFWTPLVY